MVFNFMFSSCFELFDSEKVSAFKNQWRIKKEVNWRRYMAVWSQWMAMHRKWDFNVSLLVLNYMLFMVWFIWHGSYGIGYCLKWIWILDFEWYEPVATTSFIGDSPWRSCKTRRHLNIALKSLSLHGNNSEFSTRDINLKMSLGIVNGNSYTFHILTVREIHLIIWFTGII